jgi:hypothetical protein
MGRALAEVHDLDLPALHFREARVHAKEVCRKKGRLLASLPAPDFEDGVLLVVRVGGQEQELDRLLERLAFARELLELGLGELAQLGVSERFLVLSDLLFDLAVAVKARN